MSEDRFEDEEVVDDELVRGFMATSGRVRTQGAEELDPATLISATELGRRSADEAQFERRMILESLTGYVAVAELGARLNLPLRACVVLTSEMAAEGLVHAERTIHSDDVDLGTLARIRAAIVNL